MAPAARPASDPADGGAVLMPVIQGVLEALPADGVGRLMLCDRRILQAISSLRPHLLAKRGRHPEWSWQKVHAVEGASFCDLMGEPGVWTPGPNGGGARNILEGEAGACPWTWLSGGTDWQGFQGGFRQVSEHGIRPTWVTFRVRVATPELSGAFLTLSGEQRLWGMADPVLVFSYRGDDSSAQRRCFAVQPLPKQQGSPLHTLKLEEEVSMHRPYDIALRLDWAAGLLSVFVDGRRHPGDVPFSTAVPIRYAAIYNWRSGARTAFSELMLGDDCPYDLPGGAALRRPSGARRLCGVCCRRQAKALQPSSLGGGAAWAMRGAVLVCIAAALWQHVQLQPL